MYCRDSDGEDIYPHYGMGPLNGSYQPNYEKDPEADHYGTWLYCTCCINERRTEAEKKA